METKIMTLEEMLEACKTDSHLTISFVDGTWTLAIDDDEIIGCEKEI